jgi:hypothetical protein
MTEWDIFPFEGDIRGKELAPPVIPEPPRSGDPVAHRARRAPGPTNTTLWVDDNWRVVASPTPTAVPFVILETRAHHDLADMPPPLSGSVLPPMDRIEWWDVLDAVGDCLAAGGGQRQHRRPT